MPNDLFSILLPIINAAGIPILAIGIIILLRAYQKASETYRDTSNYLRDENERLGKRLATAEANHFNDYEKMRVMASNSINAIQELQARKVSLLTQSESLATQEILAEVKKINDTIELLQNMSSMISVLSIDNQRKFDSINENFQKITQQVSLMADQIGDTKSRVAILGAITSTKVLDGIKSEVDISRRGIVAPPIEFFVLDGENGEDEE